MRVWKSLNHYSFFVGNDKKKEKSISSFIKTNRMLRTKIFTKEKQSSGKKELCSVISSSQLLGKVFVTMDAEDQLHATSATSSHSPTEPFRGQPMTSQPYHPRIPPPRRLVNLLHSFVRCDRPPSPIPRIPCTHTHIDARVNATRFNLLVFSCTRFLSSLTPPSPNFHLVLAFLFSSSEPARSSPRASRDVSIMKVNQQVLTMAAVGQISSVMRNKRAGFRRRGPTRATCFDSPSYILSRFAVLCFPSVPRRDPSPPSPLPHHCCSTHALVLLPKRRRRRRRGRNKKMVHLSALAMMQ